MWQSVAGKSGREKMPLKHGTRAFCLSQGRLSI